MFLLFASDVSEKSLEHLVVVFCCYTQQAIEFARANIIVTYHCLPTIIMNAHRRNTLKLKDKMKWMFNEKLHYQIQRLMIEAKKIIMFIKINLNIHKKLNELIRK